MATLHASDRSNLGFDSRLVSFCFFEPHSKKHSKRAKIPQIHSKYSKFRLCTGLTTAGCTKEFDIGEDFIQAQKCAN